MKQKTPILLLAGIGMAMASTVGFAATGYVDDSSGSIVRTGDGDCLHTTRWSVPNAIVECDPEIVAARDAIDVAAVEVVMVTKRNPIRLQADTLFAFDSDELTSKGSAVLDDLLAEMTVEALMEHKLQIRGYADRIGSAEYNLDLSKRRAATVRDYLVAKGLGPSFIEMSGLGSTNPLVACEGIRGAALIECLAPNRRTELEFSAVEVVEVEEKRPVQK